MLDQEIPPARPVTEQVADRGKRGRVDLAALGGPRRTPPALGRLLRLARGLI
jgi:hypothetical protein